MIFKEKRFQPIPIPKKGPLNIFANFGQVAISDDGKIYELINNNLFTDGEYCLEKPTKCSASCIFYKKHIYCVGLIQNEKFNIESHEWSSFAKTPTENLFKTYYWNEKLYAKRRDILLEYNFTNDIWIKKNLTSKSKFNMRFEIN